MCWHTIFNSCSQSDDLNLELMLNYSEASRSRQVIVGLIDASLSMAFTIFFIIQMPDFVNSYINDDDGTWLALIVFVLYRFFSLLFFNQTAGMWLSRVILLNGEDKPLGFPEKALVAIFILFRGTSYYEVK